jgi:hypothetical protein
VRGKIQISQSTAEHLEESGKGYWFRPRKDTVVAKGKGILKTHWLEVAPNRKLAENISQQETPEMIKQRRLVDWMTEVLCDSIKKIVSILV